jgi:hypothetical protein
MKGFKGFKPGGKSGGKSETMPRAPKFATPPPAPMLGAPTRNGSPFKATIGGANPLAKGPLNKRGF